MAGATTCPECGKRVSAFAAGCVCGADLEAYARRRRAEEVAYEERPRRLPRIELAKRWPLSVAESVYLALTIAAVIWVSVLGILLGVLGVMHGHYEGRTWWAVLCGALAAAALGLELSRL